MKRKTTKTIIGAFFLSILIFLLTNQSIIKFLAIPTEMFVFEGEEVSLLDNEVIPTFKQSDDNIIAFQTKDNKLNIKGNSVGETEVVFRFAGLPLKKVNVKVLKELRVVPGGQSIGVQLNTLGVLVVGYHKIDSEEKKYSPGEEAGICVGDIITRINNVKINNMEEFSDSLSSNDGEVITVEYMRGKESKSIEITPAKDAIDNAHKLGLYIRDSAAGIGTLTFYEPKTEKFGALGHVISDADTKDPIVVKDGTIFRSKVTSIDKGLTGDPGEKLADFASIGNPIGEIHSNTPFGIFGQLTSAMDSSDNVTKIPIALASEVKKGPADIYTVIEGKEIEKFAVEVVQNIPQSYPATKGLVIKITDKKLLEKTGGIIQGMSGSPIIQNGKIIGAVTHVFVNDPTSGYGVHIEWMLQEIGIDIFEETKKAG